jgi:hypothetical protein
MDDGVLAYFSWPGAHEHDAERAVRAGLELLEEVANLRAAFPSTSGSASTPASSSSAIFFGNGALQQEGLVGNVPNLAARLALATSDSIVISPARGASSVTCPVTPT